MKYEQKYTFAAGLETVYADGGANFTFLPVFIDARPEFQLARHEQSFYQGSLARTKFVAGQGSYAVAAKFYLKGFAGSAPEIGKILQLAGLGEITSTDIIYVPVDEEAEQKSATININLDGTLYKMKGTRAESLTIPLEAGSPVLCEAKLRGLYTAPSGSVLAIPTYDDASILPPIVTGMVLTVGGNSFTIPSMVFELKNRLSVVTSITGAYRGIERFVIAGRDWGGKMLVKVDSNNDLAWWTNLVASNEVALATTTGFGGMGVDIRFSATNIQLEDVKPVVKDGFHYYDVAFRLNKAPTPNNEFTLFFN